MHFKHTAKIIKEVLKSFKMDKDLADLLGIHAQFVSNWKRGLAGIPANHVKILSKYVSIEALEQAAIEDFKASWRSNVRRGY